MQSNPRDVNSDKFVTGTGRFVWLRALRGRLDDLAGSPHADAIVRRQVHLIIVAAPEPWQDEAAHFMRHLEFLPLAGLAFVVQNVSSDRRAAIIAIFPLHVDGIATGTGCVQ